MLKNAKKLNTVNEKGQLQKDISQIPLVMSMPMLNDILAMQENTLQDTMNRTKRLNLTTSYFASCVAAIEAVTSRCWL